MFVAGAIIWANVMPRIRNYATREWETELRYYGWPVVCSVQDSGISSWPTREGGDPVPPSTYTEYFRLTVDLAVALTILFAVWFVCERWIAWREKRRKRE